MIPSPQVLSDLLDHAAERYPEHGFGYIMLHRPEEFHSFPETRTRALSVLHALQQHGIRPGDHLILSLDAASSIIPALWACFYGGIIPALLQPPLTFTEYNPAAEKVNRVWEILGCPGVILSHAHADAWRNSPISPDKLLDISSLYGNADNAVLSPGKAGDPALIQFSSGSTGDPKGVILSHENILANTASIIKGIRLEAEDVSVNWMPLYHDMGLIGFHITPVFAGVTQYFINPPDFVKNPFLWLDMLSEKRCTITACPNFGQMLINRHLARKQTKTWDLSSVRILFNGAEPISVSTMRGFLEGLAPFGLNPTAMFPAYGLAEATLAVTFPEPDSGAVIKAFDRMKLIREGMSEEVPDDDSGALELVALGAPLEPETVMLADRFFRPIGEGIVGDILVRGKNITRGYYNNENETLAAFHNDWLLTGDRGFRFLGQLYITGRSKDIIFMNGANYYAHDIEQMATRMEGISLGRIVVSGYFDDAAGRDRLLVFLVASNQEESRALCVKLKNHLSISAGLNPELFILLRSADIPRTSSGKIQRFKLVERFLRSEFSDILTL